MKSNGYLLERLLSFCYGFYDLRSVIPRKLRSCLELRDDRGA